MIYLHTVKMRYSNSNLIAFSPTNKHLGSLLLVYKTLHLGHRHTSYIPVSHEEGSQIPLICLLQLHQLPHSYLDGA